MTAATTKTKKTPLGGTVLKFNVGDLRAAFLAVRDAVPGRPARPILANVLLGGGGLCATDLELRVAYPLPEAQCDPVLLPHARMLQILQSCEDKDDVTLAVDGSTCRVTCGKGKWTLPTADSSEFPPVKEVLSRPLSRLPADQFVNMMRCVRFAADPKHGRPGFAGVLLEFKDGELAFVATDGRRMCCSKADVDQALDDLSALVPRRAVDTICKLCNGRGAIQVDVAGGELVADIDGVVVRAVLLQGEPPKWRTAIPERDTLLSVCGVSTLLHTLRMAEVCTSQTSLGVTLTFSDKGLAVTGRSPEYGESSARCELVEVGTKGSVSLNPAYAVEWLETIDQAAMVDIDVADATSNVLLRCEDAFTVISPLAG